MTSAPAEVELGSIGVWPADALARLRDAWITTADQLIGLAATDGGVAALEQATGLDRQRIRQLVSETRRALPPDRASQLERPVDTSSFGLGAEEPE